MNRKRNVFCLVLFAMLFSPALAKGKSSPPNPEALLQVFEAVAAESTGDLKIPEPVFTNHCNAQQTCPNYCAVSCTGHTNCTVQSTSVTCDGVTTNCPYPSCSPPPVCQSPGGCLAYCACRAAGGGIQCWKDCT